MAPVLEKLKRRADPRLLVGINTADDAGVFLLRDGLALVQTVDLLTPVVEDPYVFGRIAAANSLSDVYAMGGQPLTALNVAGFPAPGDKSWLVGILQGGEDAVAEAGAVVAGGHTFNEPEIKYGLAVTGQVDPKNIITNAGAKPGNVLVLTKPLGTGVFSQAFVERDAVDPGLYRAATESMMTLNRDASQAMAACEASAATDITGYGFVGHAQEMAEASGVAFRMHTGDVPLLPGVAGLSQEGVVDAGVAMNEVAFQSCVRWAEGVAAALRNLFLGSETSGGLLVALPPRCVEEFRERCGGVCPVVGEVVDGPAGNVEVGE